MTQTKKIQRINFIEFNAKVNTLAHAKIFPKYGTILLASVLREKGYEVKVFLEGVSNMSFSKMTDCDLLCVPIYAPIFNKVKNFTKKVKQACPDIPTIVGGPFAILYPETILDFGDYTVRCEGDEVLPELIEYIEKGKDPVAVKGISFIRNGKIINTPDREPPKIPDTISDYNLIQGINRFTAAFGKLYNVCNTLQTSRGCKFKCSFCPTSELFSRSYRNRNIDGIIEEIKYKTKFNNWFLVVDNSFMGNREKAKDLLKRLEKEDLGADLIVFERHEIGYDEELIKLMKRGGVKCVIVGVESLIDADLKALNKKQTSEHAMEAVHNFKKHGIHVLSTFAFGSEGDTKEEVNEIVRVVRKNKLSLNVFILHDIHNDESKNLFIPLNRRFATYYNMTDPSNTDFHDYMTGSFMTYFPKHMKPSTMQKCLLDIYNGVYTHGYLMRFNFNKHIFQALMAITHGYGIRRMNKSVERIVDSYYMDYLKKIEDGLYDENEHLIEEKLADIKGLPIPVPIIERVDMVSNQFIIVLVSLPSFIRYIIHRINWRIGKLFRRKYIRGQEEYAAG